MSSQGLRQCFRDVTPYLIFLVITSTLGPLLFGYHLAELNAPEDVLTCRQPALHDLIASQPDMNLPPCIPMNETEFAALCSMFVVGGFLGALFAGPLSSKHGRLLAMRLTAFFFIIGASIESLSGSVMMFSTGRFLSGIGAGASTVIVPIYISEIAPPKDKGLFGAFTQVMINGGILITQVLGYYLSKADVWRIIMAVGAGIGLLQAFGLMFVPESPSWQAINRDPHIALRTLQRIRGHNIAIHEETRDWDLDKGNQEGESLLHTPPRSPTRSPIRPEIRRGSSQSKVSSHLPHVSFFGVVKDPQYRPAIIAVIGIMFAQQLCGINSIMMYSVSLLHGVLPMSSSLLTIMISIINVMTTILCSPLPDRIGRKTCLLVSITGMGSMAFALAVSLRLEIKILSALSVILFVAFFATGLGPVPFIMASELVGQEAVGATQSWCLAANYIATFLVAQFFPLMNTWMNHRWGGKGWAFFVFAGLAAASFAFIAWWVPETRGKKDPDEVWGRESRRGSRID